MIVDKRNFRSGFPAPIHRTHRESTLPSTANDREAAPCGTARIRLTVSQVCDEMNLLNPEGPWVYKSAHPGDQNGNRG
jgi:hypothetical protein